MKPPEIRLWLRMLLRALWLILAIAVLRIGYVAYTRRAPQITYSPVPTETNPPKPLPNDPQSMQKALIESLGIRPVPLPSELLANVEAPTTVASSAPKKPAVTRIYVAIHQGPARTEVRLNGVTLGHTPYVGEITCRHGETLEFILLPPQGIPRRSLHVCDRTEISITDKPQDSPSP